MPPIMILDDSDYPSEKKSRLDSNLHSYKNHRPFPYLQSIGLYPAFQCSLLEFEVSYWNVSNGWQFLCCIDTKFHCFSESIILTHQESSLYLLKKNNLTAIFKTYNS